MILFEQSLQLWQHQCSYHSATAQVVSVTSSKVQIAGSVTGASILTPSLPYIFIALNDNTVHCLYRDTLKQVMCFYHILY